MNRVELMASQQVFASDDQLALRGADGAMRPVSCMTPTLLLAAVAAVGAGHFAVQTAARRTAARAAQAAGYGRFAAVEERAAGFGQTVDSLSVLALSRTRAGLMLGENA
jgi:hypothetical protein